LVISFLDQLIV